MRGYQYRQNFEEDVREFIEKKNRKLKWYEYIFYTILFFLVMSVPYLVLRNFLKTDYAVEALWMGIVGPFWFLAYIFFYRAVEDKINDRWMKREDVLIFLAKKFNARQELIKKIEADAELDRTDSETEHAYKVLTYLCNK